MMRGAIRDQFAQRRDPLLAVGLPDERNAATKHQVTGKQDTGLGDKHRQILRRMGRPDMADRNSNEPMRSVDLRVWSSHRSAPSSRVLPSIQGASSWRLASSRAAAVSEFRYSRPAGCARMVAPAALNDLQPVDVVGMEMRHHHITDGLRRDAPDLGDERVGECRRTQRIDDQHALFGDDEARIGDEVAIGRRTQRGVALHHPDVVGHLPGPKPQRLCRKHRGDAGRSEHKDKAKGAQQDSDDAWAVSWCNLRQVSLYPHRMILPRGICTIWIKPDDKKHVD